MISAESILEIQDRIEISAKKSSRVADNIQLMAVSKTRTLDEIIEAKKLGLNLFGENRVKEAGDKFITLEGSQKLHLIGHLQSNKIKKAVPLFDIIETVDSLKLAEKISEYALNMGKIQDVFLEQNCSGDLEKTGFNNLESILADLDRLRKLDGLRIKGLMTMAPFTKDEFAIRSAFISLRKSFDLLKNFEGLSDLKELSMGMSGDFEIAIEEGSTLVRIGTALFGARV